MMTFVVNCVVEKINYGAFRDSLYHDEFEIGKYNTLDEAIAATGRSKENWVLENDNTELVKSWKDDGGYINTYTITMQAAFDKNVLDSLR